jgi:hypothetical protein
MEILDHAGVSSSSHPRLSLSYGPNDATVRDRPLSTRVLAERARASEVVDIPLPAPPRVPAGFKPIAEAGDLTTSAWSPDSERSGLPAKRMRRVMVAAAVVTVALVAFGAGRLLQDDETSKSQGAEPVPTPSAADSDDERKAAWLSKVRAGTATDDERRKLEALCVLAGDDHCVALAKAASAPSSSAPSTSASSAAPRDVVPPVPKARPSPAPKPGGQPDPAPKVTPKGPMVDTL